MATKLLCGLLKLLGYFFMMLVLHSFLQMHSGFYVLLISWKVLIIVNN